MNKNVISTKKIIMTFLLVVLIISCTLLEFLHMNKATTDECWNTLDDVAIYLDYGLNSVFSGNVIALSNTCNQIAEFPDPKGQEVINMIKNTSAGVTHSSVRVYYADGDILTGSGFCKRTDDMDKFENIVSQGPKIYSIHKDPLHPENEIIEHMMPVVKDGEIIAMVSVIINPEAVVEFVPIYGFDGQVESFVADKESGNIVLDNYNKLGKNIFDIDTETVTSVSGYSWNAWIENIKIGKESNIAFSKNDLDKNQYLHSIQSFNHDWVVCVVADSDVVFKRVYKLRLSFVIVLVVEVVIFLVYLIWLLRITRKEIAKEAEQNNNVIQTLASDFEVVFVADLASDEARMITMSKRIGSVVKSVDSESNEVITYSSNMSIVAETLVHPEDRKSFLYNTLGEGLAKEIREENSLLFDFRAGINGKYIHYSMKAVPNKSESDTSVVVGFRDTEKEYRLRMDAEEEEAKKRVLLEEAKNYSVVAGLAGDYDYVAHINYKTQEVTRYRITDKIAAIVDKISPDLPSFQRFQLIIDKVLYEEDYENVKKQIENDAIFETLKRDKFIRFDCRLVLEDHPEYFKVKFVGDENDPYSVTVGLLNIDYLVINEKKQKEQEILLRNTELLRILSDQFEVVYDVNLETGEYEQIIKDGIYNEFVIPELSLSNNFFEDVIDNTRRVVYEEDVKEALRITTREHIKEVLRTEPFEEWSYRIKAGDELIWYRMRIAYKDSDKKNIIVGLFNINDRVLQKEAIRIYEQDALFYQRAILDNAYSYYKVNLTKNRIVSKIIERVNGEPEDYTYKFGKVLPDYDEIIQISSEKFVHDDYKDSYIDELSSYKLIEQFEKGELMPEYTCMIWSSILGLHFRKYLNYMTKDEVTGDILSMVVAYDVTEEKLKEIEQHEYINQIMSLSEDFESIYDVDLDTGRYAESIKNGKFDERILDELEKDVDYFVTQGRVIDQIVYSEDKKIVSETMSKEAISKKLLVEEGFHLDLRCVFDDRIVWYRMRVSKVGDWSKDRRILIGMINNDENMKKEKELQETLEKALSMANSANRAKTTFLNSMSHDIRTPMNAIIGFTGLAKTHIDNKDKVKDYLEKIGQSSEHLLSLINDVLDMSRIESGKVILNEKEESISEIVHALKSIVQADIKAKNLNLCIDALNVTNEKVICDKLRLNQVLLNLVSNSIKYTQNGGNIEIKLEQKESKKEGYADYSIIVKDNGMGMSEEYVKTIFDPFTREKSATVSGIQGTGLGMSITKNIVDLMGGNISVDSKKDVGTEFRIDFELKTIEDDKPVKEINELFDEKILVLCEKEEVSESVSKILTLMGVKAEKYSKADKAYKALQNASAEGEPFRAVFTDWKITGTESRDNVEKLRKYAGKDAVIVVLSVCDINDEEENLASLDINGFVTNPMFPSDIYKTLLGCIENDLSDDVEIIEEKDYSGKKVLLVEDNELNREIACELLTEMGIDIESAEDGIYAVEKFKNFDEYNFKLVLMDIQMPLMDGYEATRQIRTLENGKYSDIPIVAMTANAFEEDKKNAIDAGMNDHIAKPIDVQRLKDILNKYL